MSKRFFALFTAVLLIFACLGTGCSKQAKYTVGICRQAPHEAIDRSTEGFMDALKAELGEENIQFLVQDGQGDVSLCTTIINDFVTKNVDLILGNGTTALLAAANGTETIPVLGTSITEYGSLLGIKDYDGLVGGNVSGASDLAPLNEQAQMIVDLFPDAKTVSLLYCSAEENSAYQIKEMKKLLEKKNITVKDFPFIDSSEVVSVTNAAAAASDVIYIPTDNTIAACAEAISGVVTQTKTPIIGGDEAMCRGCGVATLCVDYYDLGVATGKMAAKILRGEANISEMPIEYSDKFTKVYNKENCQILGISAADMEAKGYTAIAE